MNKKSKKIILILSIIILIISGSIIFAQIGDADTFDSINEPTEENTEYIQKANASMVFDVLDENLEFFNKLYNKVKNSDDIDSLVDELEEGFGKLAKSFGKLVENKDEIEREFRKRMTLLNDYGDKAVSVKDRIEVEIATTSNEKDKIMEAMKSMDPDSTDIKKAKMRLNTLESKITALKTRRNVWDSYVATHEELRENLGDLSENITLFLYALEQTAEVYNEAYETLRFANRASQAIDSLQQLANIDVYSESLLNTFQQVDEIMFKLNSIDFEGSKEPEDTIDEEKPEA